MMPSLQIRPSLFLSAIVVPALCVSCGDDVENPIEANPNEVMTTVNIFFEGPNDQDPLQAQFRDADGPGGSDPSITGVTLQNGETYSVSVEFFNELSNPIENVTPEIFNERDEHQVFFVGDAVEGPATSVDSASALIRHSYADVDGLNLPIGLESTIEALRTGSSTFSVGLRHMPLINELPQKRAGLADEVRDAGGFDALNQASGLPGSWDVVVDIPFEVE